MSLHLQSFCSCSAGYWKVLSRHRARLPAISMSWSSVSHRRFPCLIWKQQRSNYCTLWDRSSLFIWLFYYFHSIYPPFRFIGSGLSIFCTSWALLSVLWLFCGIEWDGVGHNMAPHSLSDVSQVSGGPKIPDWFQKTVSTPWTCGRLWLCLNEHYKYQLFLKQFGIWEFQFLS